jgi:GT2 family glycosyltransferase
MPHNVVESDTQLTSLSIIVLCRDNERYLPRLFAMLEALERTHELHFYYLFVENGSVDNTRPLLERFLSGRSGQVLGPTNTRELDGLSRPKKLAILRNLAKQACPAEPRWTALLDTDVYFAPDILARLFAYSPSQNGMGMLCAFGMEVVPSGPSGQFATQGHYYDTSAFLDFNGDLFWPHCIFDSCIKCRDAKLVTRVSRGRPLVVASAFGGLALVRTELLKDERIHWRSRRQGTSVCEHFGFCSSLRAVSGQSVVVATRCPVYWDASTFRA